jgi:hypothetical protein
MYLAPWVEFYRLPPVDEPIRILKCIVRITVTGVRCSYGFSTNENRALKMAWKERSFPELFLNNCASL